MRKEIWKRKFVWLPTYCEQGTVSKFGFRWLTFEWHRWYEGHYESYWQLCTHKWDDGEIVD